MTIPMPEPVAWITNESLYGLKAGRTNSKGAVPVHASRSYVAKTPLITTTQAEAYADARVREALEIAAQICWEMQSSPEFGKDDKDHWLAIAERRIRALLPPT